jgi:hypothetical protein
MVILLLWWSFIRRSMIVGKRPIQLLPLVWTTKRSRAQHSRLNRIRGRCYGRFGCRSHHESSLVCCLVGWFRLAKHDRLWLLILDRNLRCPKFLELYLKLKQDKIPAFKPVQTMQTTGPDAMYVTRPGKNGRAAKSL